MTGASSASAHKVRAHGFSSPTNAFQIASWVLYVFFGALFYAVLFLYPTPAGAQAGWGVAFGIMAAITALAAVWATAVDPADVALREPAPQAGAAHAAGGAFCYYCERNVHESSKHCVECWKCVHRFDHHCVWLNSCVGSANYAAFVTLLASAAAMLAVEIALCIYLIVQFATSQTAFAAQVASFYPALPGGAFFGLAVAVLVVALAAWVLVLQLLSFHVFLIRRGLTTYDFIMGKTSSSSAPAPAPAPAPVPAPAPQPAVTESKATPFPSPHVNLLSAYRAPGLGISASASSAAAAAAAADSNTGVEVVGIVGSVEGACATAPDAGAAHDERNSRRLSLPVLG